MKPVFIFPGPIPDYTGTFVGDMLQNVNIHFYLI